MNGRLLLLLAVVVGCGAARAARAAWGDWVVGADDADAGASVLLRRITPKSVFVAPTFTGCSEGYRQDSLGRCVKLVKVNQQSQWNFFLERLNSMYSPTAASKKPVKDPGPFHINLPLGSEPAESNVHKRLPPPPPVAEVKTTQPTEPTTTTTQPATTTTTTTSTSTTTTVTPPPQTSDWPTTTTTMSESTTEVPLSTVDLSEATATEKDFVSSTETLADSRRETTTEDLDISVMLGDQPTDESDRPVDEFVRPIEETDRPVDETDRPVEETDKFVDIPKSQEVPRPQEKPFLIIVTNPTVGETSTFLPDETSIPTTEATTEVKSTETARPEEVFGETRDSTETSRPETTSSSPDCGGFDCAPLETEVEFVSGERPSSLPELPPLDPSSQVRFPSESLVPARKTQSYIRFPGQDSHEDRPAFWWPSWQIRQYPGIHGWPESEQIHGSTDGVIQRKYPYGTTWSSVAWQRRFLQRD